MPARVRIRRTVGRLRSMPSSSQQLGEVGMVGALIALGGQLNHGGSLRGRYGVVGTGAAAVTVGEGGGALLAIGRQQPAGVACAHSQQFGGLGDGHLVFQNRAEHMEPGLFFLVQRYILHGKDIFADQLATDGIVEQQQFFRVIRPAIFGDIRPLWERSKAANVRLSFATGSGLRCGAGLLRKPAGPRSGQFVLDPGDLGRFENRPYLCDRARPRSGDGRHA